MRKKIQLSLAMVGLTMLLSATGSPARAQTQELSPEQLFAREGVLSCREDVSLAQAAHDQASAEVDKLNLEILKRQQQVMTARRQGGSVSEAESELELSRDKLRLAEALAAVAELRLSLARSYLIGAELTSEKLDLRPEEQARLAEIDSRRSSVYSEAAAIELRIRVAASSAFSIADELKSKWGARFTGEKPAPQRVYQSTPDENSAPPPEEATEL